MLFHQKAFGEDVVRAEYDAEFSGSLGNTFTVRYVYLNGWEGAPGGTPEGNIGSYPGRYGGGDTTINLRKGVRLTELAPLSIVPLATTTESVEDLGFDTTETLDDRYQATGDYATSAELDTVRDSVPPALPMTFGRGPDLPVTNLTDGDMFYLTRNMTHNSGLPSIRAATATRGGITNHALETVTAVGDGTTYTLGTVEVAHENIVVPDIRESFTTDSGTASTFTRGHLGEIDHSYSYSSRYKHNPGGGTTVFIHSVRGSRYPVYSDGHRVEGAWFYSFRYTSSSIHAFGTFGNTNTNLRYVVITFDGKPDINTLPPDTGDRAGVDFIENLYTNSRSTLEIDFINMSGTSDPTSATTVAANTVNRTGLIRIVPQADISGTRYTITIAPGATITAQNGVLSGVTPSNGTLELIQPGAPSAWGVTLSHSYDFYASVTVITHFKGLYIYDEDFNGPTIDKWRAIRIT